MTRPNATDIGQRLASFYPSVKLRPEICLMFILKALIRPTYGLELNERGLSVVFYFDKGSSAA